MVSTIKFGEEKILPLIILSSLVFLAACSTTGPAVVDAEPARATECDVISRDTYFNIQRLNLVNKRYARYCKRCNDKTPQGPATVNSVSYQPVSSPNGSWGRLLINNVPVDSSNIFIETKAQNFENLILISVAVTGQPICEPKVFQKKLILN
jgi:hypothetical protein